MSFLFQNINKRSVRMASICLLAAASLSWPPLFSFAQDEAAAPVKEAEVVEIQDEDFVEFEEDVEAAQVLNAFGVETSKMIAAKRFQLTQIFRVEVEELERVCKLDKKQTTKLRIGAKGAIKKLTDEWKKNASGQMARFGQVQQDDDGNDQPADEGEEIEIKDADEIDEMTMQMVMMDSMGNPFKYDDPLDHRFWQKTIGNVLTDAQSAKFKKFKQERKTAKRNALIDSALSSLTIELGLTEQQRIKLTEVIRPPMQQADISCFTFYEPFVLYYYASKADSKKLKEVLSPAQLQKWKIFIAPSKQIGQMMEMEDGGNVFVEEENILTLIGEAIEAIADGVEALLSVYSK